MADPQDVPAAPRFPTRRLPRRPRGLPLRAVAPNAVTALALCSGLSGVRFAIGGEWQSAVAMIMVAGVLDGLDGRIARMLHGESRFGAELDSLSDFLCFGVAPALVLYMSSLKDAGALGWIVTLMFPMCSALRLARFNTALVADTPPPAWTGAYFTGVPAPAGALLALIPLVISLELKADWPRHPLIVGLVLVLVGGLMVSRLPTFSFKKGRVPRHLVLPALLGAALTMGIMVSSPWIGLSLLGLIYVSLIPFSWMSYRRQAADDRTMHERAAPSAEVVSLRAVDSSAPPRE